MQIFVLDLNPKICAQYHGNKHLVKQILETAQILCAVRHINKPLNTRPYYGTDDNIPYKLTHKNHPCVKWAADNSINYAWLLSLGENLCKEYTFRYGKRHKSEDVIGDCRAAQVFYLRYSNDNKLHYRTFLSDIIKNGFHDNIHKYVSPFTQAMPEQYKCEDAVKAYRNYYVGEKSHLAKWTKREVPSWFKFKTV